MEKDKRSRLRFYQTLGRQMIVTIITVSFAPLILVISVLLYQYHISYHQKTADHLVELVDKHTRNIDAFLNEKMANIRFLAAENRIEDLRRDLFLQEKLTSLQDEYGPVFTDLGVVDAAGVQVAYAGPFNLRKARYTDAAWFQQAIASNYFISDVFLGLRGHPHFIVAVKVGDGDQTSVLRATIDFIAFNSLVEKLRIGKTGIAYILNRRGEFQTRQMHATKSADIAFLLANSDAQKRNVQLFQDNVGNGENRIYATALLKNNDWILVFQQHADDAFGDLRRTQKITIAIFIVGGLGIVAMAIIMSRRIVKIISRADKRSEFMNKQIVETGKLASLGELAAGIAHEINNPVAIMVEEAGWISDLLEDEEFKSSKNLEEFNRALNQISIQGNRCKGITHKLLSFARKTDARVEKVDINEIVCEIVSLSAQTARGNKVTINTHLDNTLPQISVSPAEMQQVLLNLINNALYAMEKTGGTIEISTGTRNHAVIIDVTDSGPGIPDANIERIFDPFFTTKPVGKGTGLGLSICYGIVKKMGGEIEVKSTVGFGTRFRIIVPIETSPGIAGVAPKRTATTTAGSETFD